MIIWSIDVGHRNMGLAILEVPDYYSNGPRNSKDSSSSSNSTTGTNTMKNTSCTLAATSTITNTTKTIKTTTATSKPVAWENVVIKKLETVSAWSDKKVANVNKRPLREICCQVHKLLHFLIHEKFPNLPPGLVMIEQQPTRGVKNRVLEFFIYGFFLGKGIERVQQVSSKLKMSELVLKPASFSPCFAQCPAAEDAKGFNYRQRKQAAVQGAKCWHSFLKSECSAPSKPDEADALLQALAVLSQ